MSQLPTRRQFLASSVLAASMPLWARANEPAGQDPARSRFPFYAMDTGLRGPDIKSLDDAVRVLHELGYWGIDYTLDHDRLPHLLELLDQHGIELACVYLSPALEDAPDPRLADSIRRMKGRPTRIELALRSSQFKSSDPAGDARGLELIRGFSDLASDTGPVVSIYPHTGIWTERVQDGVRLSEACGRKNVGTNFNLVHWKWVKQDEPLEKVLKAALPHLLAVSINGLAENKIVPLDEGDYDLAAFVKLLQQTGYTGPVGLQGYGIPGDSQPVLKRSMARWREILAGLGPSAR